MIGRKPDAPKVRATDRGTHQRVRELQEVC
jgi:hypothetical protein